MAGRGHSLWRMRSALSRFFDYPGALQPDWDPAKPGFDSIASGLSNKYIGGVAVVGSYLHNFGGGNLNRHRAFVWITEVSGRRLLLFF
jgi:hypothetical protein